MKSIALVVIVSQIWLAVPGLAVADTARVKVALLEGKPVYHWRVFESLYSDDIDRALVLREFTRRGYTLPDNLVSDALQQKVTKIYGGDKAKLERSLQPSGMTITDYRQFLAEEIILQALPIHVTRRSKGGDSPAARAKWVASLRQGANIKLLR